MAASLGDLIQVVDRQDYLEQEVLNVFYYRVTSITGILDDYLEAFNDWFTTNVLTPIVAVQNDGLTHVERQWRNLSNGVDLFTDATPVQGDLAESSNLRVPSYVSAGFMLVRESMATRNGYKRFAGLTDGQISGNTWSVSAGLIDAIEEGLADDIVIGLVTLAEPVIVKRPLGSVPVGAYVYSSIGSAQYRGLGTQNTRKP